MRHCDDELHDGEGEEDEVESLLGEMTVSDLSDDLVDELFGLVHPTGWHRLFELLQNPSRSHLQASVDPVIETVGTSRGSDT